MAKYVVGVIFAIVVITEITESRPLTKCEQERKRVLKMYEEGAADIPIPSCLRDGSYAPKQCGGFTGWCWCVHPNGTQIPDTFGPNAECRQLSECEEEREKVLESYEHGAADIPIPVCLDDGTYAPKQCGGITGWCWCVHPNGTQIPGTFGPNAECKRLSECEVKRENVLEMLRNGAADIPVPTCLEDGSFAPKQCGGFTGWCWCVYPNGTQVPGTFQTNTDCTNI